MGADSISIELEKKATREQIESAFKRQRAHDADYNGHREGYSGDFQTVHSVDYSHLSKVFPSQDEAFEYCLKHAEKFCTVVAVYYVEGTPLKSAKLDKLNAKIEFSVELLQTIKCMSFDRDKAFKTCGGCKSRLAVARFKGSNCPVCGFDLRSAKLINNIRTLNEKIEQLRKDRQALIDQLNAKRKIKDKDVKTLVAGWGAC